MRLMFHQISVIVGLTLPVGRNILPRADCSCMPLRLSAEWMVQADDRLLEFLSVEGPHTPKRISDDDRIEYRTKHVNVRLLKLLDYGLVEKSPIGQGVYQITDDGRAYLSGDLDASSLDASE